MPITAGGPGARKSFRLKRVSVGGRYAAAGDGEGRVGGRAGEHDLAVTKLSRQVKQSEIGSLGLAVDEQEIEVKQAEEATADRRHHPPGQGKRLDAALERTRNAAPSGAAG